MPEPAEWLAQGFNLRQAYGAHQAYWFGAQDEVFLKVFGAGDHDFAHLILALTGTPVYQGDLGAESYVGVIQEALHRPLIGISSVKDPAILLDPQSFVAAVKGRDMIYRSSENMTRTLTWLVAGQKNQSMDETYRSFNAETENLIEAAKQYGITVEQGTRDNKRTWEIKTSDGQRYAYNHGDPPITQLPSGTNGVEEFRPFEPHSEKEILEVFEKIRPVLSDLQPAIHAISPKTTDGATLVELLGDMPVSAVHARMNGGTVPLAISKEAQLRAQRAKHSTAQQAVDARDERPVVQAEHDTLPPPRGADGKSEHLVVERQPAASHARPKPISPEARIAGGVAGVAGLALTAYGVAEVIRRKKEGETALAAVGGMVRDMPGGMLEESGIGHAGTDNTKYVAGMASTALTGGLIQSAAWIDNIRGREAAKNVTQAQFDALMAKFRTDVPIIPHNADPLVERIDTVLRLQKEGATSVRVMLNPLNGDLVVLGKCDGEAPLMAEPGNVVMDMPVGDFLNGAAALAIAKGIGPEAVQGAYDSKFFDERRADAVLMRMGDVTAGGTTVYQGLILELHPLQKAMDERNRLLAVDPDGDDARWEQCRRLALQFLDNVPGASPDMADRELNGVGRITLARAEDFVAAGMSGILGLNGDVQHDKMQLMAYVQQHRLDMGRDGGDGIFDASDLLAQLSPQALIEVDAARTRMAGAMAAANAPSSGEIQVAQQPASARIR